MSEEKEIKYVLKTVENQVAFRVLDGNPFRKGKIGMLDLPTAEDINESDDSDKEINGYVNKIEQNVICGYVTAVGPCVKTTKPGDIIYLDINSMVAIPYYDGTDEIIYKLHEQQIYAVISRVEE